jgi:purine-binding chemotaxis protein CheW
MTRDDDFDFDFDHHVAHPSRHTGPSLRQYLVLTISGLELGIPLERVSEAIPYDGFSPLPGAPNDVLGLVHVRGRVVPVFDLGPALGRPACALSKRSCVLMLELSFDHDSLHVGVVMDGVASLLDVDESEIRPPPKLGAQVSLQHIRGVVPTPSGILPLVAIETLFTEEDLRSVGDFSSMPPSAASTPAG